MQIRKLDTTRLADVRQFVRFPFEVYRHYPQWVPPLQSDAMAVLDREHHPFYRHSTADFFVVESKGKTLGRIAVSHNRRYTEYTGRKDAFFYYFDCVEDASVAYTLFYAAADWARQQGLESLMGPRGLVRADGVGLLIEGFEHRPAPGIPYNPPYYGPFLEQFGFEKEVDYLSGYLRRGYELPPRFFDVAAKVKAKRGFWIRSFANKEELRRVIPNISRIYNEAFTDVWGYYPVDEAELALIAQRLLAIADPRLIKLVMKGDDVAGFVLAYPDLSAAIQRTKGWLWPLGWLDLQREFKRTRRLNINGMGLLPQYQGSGAMAVLYTELYQSIMEQFNFDDADLAQAAETNFKSLGEAEALGVQWYKRHRVYRRWL